MHEDRGSITLITTTGERLEIAPGDEIREKTSYDPNWRRVVQVNPNVVLVNFNGHQIYLSHDWATRSHEDGGLEVRAGDPATYLRLIYAGAVRRLVTFTLIYVGLWWLFRLPLLFLVVVLAFGFVVEMSHLPARMRWYGISPRHRK